MAVERVIVTPEYKALIKSALQLGIKLRAPKYNCPNCYGRGWIGKRMGTQEVVPCSCILPKETDDRDLGGFHFRARNRAERRKQMKEDLKYWSSVYKKETKTDKPADKQESKD